MVFVLVFFIRCRILFNGCFLLRGPQLSEAFSADCLLLDSRSGTIVSFCACLNSFKLLVFLRQISEISAWRLVFWNSIHLEVASDSFCFLLYSSWLLVFILYVFSLFFSFINLYCWKGLLFSQNNFLIFIFIIVGLIFSFYFWFRDLLRELDKKYRLKTDSRLI